MKTSKPTTADAFKLLMEGSRVLTRMEHHGIAIDEKYLAETSAKVSRRIKKLTEKLKRDEIWFAWRKRYADKALLTSDAQLTEILFTVLKHPYPKGDEWRTATGRYRADEEMIGRINLPFTKSWKKLKKLNRLQGTYLSGIKREVVNGRVHPGFNLHTVETYRSSASDPNIQNQYNRDPEMKDLLRRCFVSSPGCCLVEVDFSTIEVRVSCALHKDPTLVKYMKDPTTDMHRDTAAELYMLPVDYLIEHRDWAKKNVRDWAKNRFVFPQFYGSVFFQCAPNLWKPVADSTLPDGTSLLEHLKSKGIRKLGKKDSNWNSGRIVTPSNTFMEHVRNVERSFWEERFPVYTAWKRKTYDAYLERGYVDTLTGFRLSGLYRRNEILNGDIQGSSFHCLLWSLIQIQKELTRRKLKAELVAEVHDSLLADVPVGEVDEFLDLCHEVMTERLPRTWKWLNVPMETESEVCVKNWAEKVVYVRHENGKWGPK